MQDQGCDEKTIYKALNVSRTTLFRWKKLYKEEELAGLENVSRKPHKVRQSIQVDGGSEFMAEFEQGCKKRNISLFVLPPRSPKLNGCVERSNGTMHYEFYVLYPSFNDLSDLNQKLAEFTRFYNEKRPHQRLNYSTPMRYLEDRRAQNEIF